MKNSKLVVFDVDGTILDSYGLYEKVVYNYSMDNNLPVPDLQAIKHGYGDPHKHDFKWGGTREDQVRHMYATFDIADIWSVSGEPEKTPGLFDGVKETLKYLKELGHELAIVTSKAEKPLLHLLDYHGVTGMFAGHRNRTDVKRRGEREKPHPDQLQSIMNELNFTPENTIMIGDTTMDMRMGRSAGTHAVGVTWGVHPYDHLQDAGAQHIIDTHINDLAPLIQKIAE